MLAGKLGAEAYLAGDVAVALRLHHRRSRDLDFFTHAEHPERLAEALAQVPGLRISSRAEGTLYFDLQGLPVCLIRYRYPLLAAVERLPDIPVPVASQKDLICMKLAAIASRGAVRDFWDLHALLGAAGVGLAEALAWYRCKYKHEDIGHVVRSLVHFADADAEPLPQPLTAPRWERVKADFRSWVKAI